MVRKMFESKFLNTMIRRRNVKIMVCMILLITEGHKIDHRDNLIDKCNDNIIVGQMTVQNVDVFRSW